MTPEGRVKKMVKKALDSLGPDCWRFMPVQSGYGTVALDYLLCIRSRFVAIETKAPGKKLTALQESTKAAMEAAGGIVLVVWDEGSLAIAMKIVLALEFAPHAYHDAGRCLDATRTSYTGDYRAVRHQKTQGPHEQHQRAEQQGQALDATTGGDHGAPRKAPARRAKPAASVDDQRLTATVTEPKYCTCGAFAQLGSNLQHASWCPQSGED